MSRFALLLRTLLALCAFSLFLGCPPTADDDDDDVVDDDDDDDDAADPCADVTDATSSINGGSLTGSTSGPNDALMGSCANPDNSAPEVVFAITAPEDGPIIASTANAGTDFDTILYVLGDCSDSSSEIACDDDGGGQGPSLLSFDAVAGTEYFIVVDGYDGSGNFDLTIEQVICGDGNVAGDEQCDDGNTDAGDGCDASCAWECVDDSMEPNSIPEDASDLSGETFPATVADLVLCPSDVNEEFGLYIDFYEVTVAEGEYIEVEVQGGATLTTTCADQQLSVALVNVFINGLADGNTDEGTCAFAAAEPEAPGTYYIAVFAGDQTIAPQDYTLSVDVGTSVCGDGEQTGTEECDDSNTTGGDGCSAACVLEDATCPIEGDATGAVDGANLTGSTAAATDAHEPQSCGAADGAPDIAYELTMLEDGPVILSLDNAGTDFDTVMYVRETCLDPGSEIACNDDGPKGLSSVLFFDAVKDIPYTIVIDGYADASGAYELSLTVPVCGDTNVDMNEDCDDGNQTPGDGCENDCTVTPVCSYTPDDDLGTLASGSTTTHSVTLVAGGDTLPDLTCSDVAGGDAMVQFEVTTAGTLTVDFTQDGDAQLGLFADDGTCAEAVCLDAGEGATEGQLTATVAPGVHFLILDTYAEGGEGTVNLSLIAP